MFQLKPIAFVKNNRKKVEDDQWQKVMSTIELIDELNEACIQGIEQFSHIEVIFYFDQVKDEKIAYGARHPRNNKAYPKVGIFAQRGKNRPNRIGLTTVPLLKKVGKKLFVEGLDAIDQTPVLDLKPVMKEFLPKGTIEQPQWSKEIMKHYW